MLVNVLPNSRVVEKCLRLLNLENYRHPYLDHGAKKLLAGKAILLFVEAFLHQRLSLWDMEENLKSKCSLQDLVELEGVHSSTLYRKLTKLPTDFLQDLAVNLFSQIDQHYRKNGNIQTMGKLRIVDSTEIRLPNLAGEWAYASKEKNGVKIHLRLVVLNEHTSYPDKVICTTSGVSDVEMAVHLVVDRDATYVMDRGYINYHLYQEWIQKKIKFVVRLKGNSRTKILKEREVPSGSSIIRDADVEIYDVKNDKYFKVRLVEYKDEQNRIYRILTNRWVRTAEQIAEIYRQRWKIELFFKWMKQHIKMVRLFNYKPEAVWNQLWLAMIAYALSEIIKIQTKTKRSTWQVLQLLRHYWNDSWELFLQALFREPTRNSKGRRKKGKAGRPRKHPKKLKSVKIVSGKDIY